MSFTGNSVTVTVGSERLSGIIRAVLLLHGNAGGEVLSVATLCITVIRKLLFVFFSIV